MNLDVPRRTRTLMPMPGQPRAALYSCPGTVSSAQDTDEGGQVHDTQELLQPVHKWFAAYRFVKSEIRRGRWYTDETISANLIAQELGMSRSPVQQALRVLARDGLVEIVPQVGFVIRKPRASEIEEGFSIRVALDRLAAELAAEHADEHAIASLKDLVDASEEAARCGDGARYATLNRAFHTALYDMAHNHQLRAAAERLWEPFQSPCEAAPFFEPRMERSVREHRAILHAIKRHDADEAGRIVKKHVEECKASMLAYLGAGQHQLREEAAPPCP